MSDSPHIPPPANADDRHNARLGLWLFALYTLIYGVFMVLNAFYPGAMAAKPFGGLNLAVIYGFGLIVGALVLAIIYLLLARGGKDAH